MTALLLGQGLYGLAMGMSNSHEMSYRQLVTPDELQARTNTTLRSTNRAVIVIAAPVTGVVADAWGMTHARYGPILASLEETAVPPLWSAGPTGTTGYGVGVVSGPRDASFSLYTHLGLATAAWGVVPK